MTQANNVAIESSQINSSGVLQPAGGGTGTASGVTDFKNRIINGAMVIDQRNSGNSAALGAGGPGYALDRWAYYVPNNTSGTIQQVSDAPTGFVNSLKFTQGTGTTVTTQNEIYQPIEGYNVSDLGFGTANAKTITISFWVKSSLTGTFNIAIENQSSSRAYVSTYSISSANTWTQASVTIPGDTTGTWLTNNSTGLNVLFSLGQSASFQTTPNAWTAGDYKGSSGAVSVVATTGATWQLTGVQLEVGSSATNFAYRSYGTELALCQRYYQNVMYSGPYANSTVGQDHGSAQYRFPFTFPQIMRSSPSITTAAITSFRGNGVNGDNDLTSGTITINNIFPQGFGLFITSMSPNPSTAAGQAIILNTASTISGNTVVVAASAEL